MTKARARKAAPRPVRAPVAAAATLPAAVARTVWAILAVLILLRAITAFEPSMWGWSVNLQRFLPPLLGWGLWAAAALALIPAVAKALAPTWNAAGDAIAEHPALSTWAAVVTAVLVVGVWPDRVRFTGDFLLRQGTLDVAEQFSLLFPQALPLDVFLHYTVPRVLTNALALDGNHSARLLGMIEAGGLAGLAIAFARTLRLTGGAGLAVAAVVFFGGYLGMYTGFSKAFAEMCLLVAIVGVQGLRVVREGRGLLWLGLALAIGVTLHRSALGLLPAVAFAWVTWWRVHADARAWKRPELWAALAIPLAALVVMVPRIVAVARRWDVAHFDPRAIDLQGGVLGAAFAGARPVDFVNLPVMLSPLVALLLTWVVLARPKARGPGCEAALLVLLALPFVLVLPFLHPAQGLFRDWDDFAAMGVAISLVVAWTVAQALRESPRHALAVAITLAAVAPTMQWLAHNADLPRGLERVRAFVLEPPDRARRERGTTWDYVGIREFALEHWEQAAEAFGHAASTSPSARILQEWALAESMRGQFGLAQKVYYRFLQKAPDNELGWLGLAQVSMRLSDWPEARRAAHRVLELDPGNTDALRVLAEVQQLEGAAPSPAPAPGASPP